MLPPFSIPTIRATAGFSTPGGCPRCSQRRSPQRIPQRNQLGTMLQSTPRRPLAKSLSYHPVLVSRHQTHLRGFASVAPRLCADQRQ